MENQSVSEALKTYLESKKSEVTSTTIEAHTRRLKFFVEWCEKEGIETVGELKPEDMEEYRQWRRKDGNLKPVSEKTQMDTLRVFIRYLERMNAVQDRLEDSVISPKLDDGENQSDATIDEERLESILEYMEKYHYASVDHVILLLIWKIGFRISGVKALDMSDFSYRNNSLEVKNRVDRGTRLKNGDSAERVVYLDGETAQILSDYVEEVREDVRDENGREPLVSTEYGRMKKNKIRNRLYKITRPCWYSDTCPHSKDIDSCEWNSYKKASKCPSTRSPHVVRRASITHHLRENVPEKVVSDRCDVSPEVLDKHYDSRSEREKMESRKKYLENI
jgi:site-specific recombinase XerD